MNPEVDTLDDRHDILLSLKIEKDAIIDSVKLSSHLIFLLQTECLIHVVLINLMKY